MGFSGVCVCIWMVRAGLIAAQFQGPVLGGEPVGEADSCACMK